MIPRGHKLQIPPYNVTSESHEKKGKDNLRSCWSLYKFSLWHLRKNIENSMKNMATDHSKLIGLWFGSSLIQILLSFLFYLLIIYLFRFTLPGKSSCLLGSSNFYVKFSLRFWLSRAIEGFLRGRASVGDQLFLIKRGLLEVSFSLINLIDNIWKYPRAG